MSRLNTSIVIGYGAFGRRVLRRLLVATAERGALSWRSPQGGQDSSQRSLRDLGLIWVPDFLGLEPPHDRQLDVEGGASFEMMEDLYRHIVEIKAKAPDSETLVAAVDEMAQGLLHASGRLAEDESRPLMLNVMVIARPSAPAVLGALNEMLAPAMDRLAAYPNLVRPQEGADLLNFVQLLDFDHYWQEGPSPAELREAVRLSVEHWQERVAAGKPGFGRVYLSDTYISDGVRDAAQRIDEMVLFLELLLFESQDPGLEALYRRERDALSPVGTFGVRLVERSSELLSRLAAARFAVHWLDYLANDPGSGEEAGLSDLNAVLAPLTEGRLQDLLAEGEMRARLEEENQSLLDQLAALPLENADWSARVHQKARQGLQGVRDRLFEESGRRLGELRERHLEPFPEKLAMAVGQALHHAAEPVSTARVIADLERAAQVLESTEEVPPTESHTVDEGATLSELEDFHASYRHFRENQVHPPSHRRLWPFLFALMLGVAGAPLLAQSMVGWGQPDRHYLLRALHGWANTPWIILPLLSLFLFGLLFLVLRMALDKRVERGRRFFDDPIRGRAAYHLGRLMGPGSALRAPVDDMIQRMVHDYSFSIRGFAGGEIARVLKRLRRRRREMLWLREQLIHFLRMHGLEPEGDLEGFESLRRRQSQVRQSLETSAELGRIIEFNPPRQDRFQSTQSTIRLFEDWEERFSVSFLYPLRFLDGPLSRIYRDRLREDRSQDESSGQGDWVDRLEKALRRQGDFDVGFKWHAAEGLRVAVNSAVAPERWSRLGPVREALADNAFSESKIFRGGDAERLYLVRVQVALAPKHLTRTL